jgi:hypothetical protein
MPPEAIYLNESLKLAMVKNHINLESLRCFEGAGNHHDLHFDLVLADPSFDVWSLGMA